MNKKLVLIILSVVLSVMSPVGAVLAQEGSPPRQSTVHIVQYGETLSSIASRYGTTVDAVSHANGLADPRRIYVGQRLVIPGSGVEVGETTTYVVQAGDTLDSLARRYGTTWQALARMNGLLSPQLLYVGQVIQVPADSPWADATVGGNLYTVRPGDTLTRIALRYGTPVWALAEANQIANPTLLTVGRELAVPGDGSGDLPLPFLSVEMAPLPVAQGQTMVVAVRTTDPVQLSGTIFDRPIRFGQEGDTYYGLVGVRTIPEQPGLYELSIVATDGDGNHTAVSTSVLVESGGYGYERISVPASRTGLLDPNLLAAEREKLNQVRGTFSPLRRWGEVFHRPCVGAITSYFGTWRAYNDGPFVEPHSGVDFNGGTGTPVYASAAGTVVLAEPLVVLGQMVIVDHGWGVLTGYGHLSTIEVEVGQEVALGERIGRIGGTGLVTGPHLHWQVWVGGISVNGLQWLQPFYLWPTTAQAEGGASESDALGRME